MKKDESGYIVVETVGTFIPLVLLVISILSLVNIVAVQARVHYALTQAATKISIYGYLTKDIDTASGGIESGALDSVFNGINEVMGIVGLSDSEPISTIGGLIRFAGGGSNFLVDILINPLVKGYLANGDMSGDDFLKSFHIHEFDLGLSKPMDSDENVRITARYAVDYTFGALPLPFGPKLRITQTAVTKMWTGHGDRYGR